MLCEMNWLGESVVKTRMKKKGKEGCLWFNLSLLDKLVYNCWILRTNSCHSHHATLCCTHSRWHGMNSFVSWLLFLRVATGRERPIQTKIPPSRRCYLKYFPEAFETTLLYSFEIGGCPLHLSLLSLVCRLLSLRQCSTNFAFLLLLNSYFFPLVFFAHWLPTRKAASIGHSAGPSHSWNLPHSVHSSFCSSAAAASFSSPS